jgi:hypothetical protein
MMTSVTGWFADSNFASTGKLRTSMSATISNVRVDTASSGTSYRKPAAEYQNNAWRFTDPSNYCCKLFHLDVSYAASHNRDSTVFPSSPPVR